jgi:hypothetical protein
MNSEINLLFRNEGNWRLVTIKYLLKIIIIMKKIIEKTQNSKIFINEYSLNLYKSHKHYSQNNLYVEMKLLILNQTWK